MVVGMLVSVDSMRVRLMPPPQWDWHSVGLTGPGAFELTQITASGQSLHMVMVTGLG